MKILLLFVAAQLAGNGIACLIAAIAWHFARPRLVASRLRDLELHHKLAELESYTAELKPC